MQSGKCFAVVLFFVSLAGCGSVRDTPVNVTPVAATESIKSMLTDLAATGEKSSGIMNLEEDIEKLRSTDPAKADALKKGYDELQALKDPASIQAKAREMLSKL